MNTLRVFTTIAAALIAAGCGRGPEGNGSASGDADGGVFDGSTSQSPTGAATEAATRSVDIAASAIAAVAPLQTLESILSSGGPMTVCPAVDAEFSGINSLGVTLDYSGNCRLPDFSEVAIRGVIRGSYHPARYEFDVSFDDLVIHGTPIEGGVAGSLKRSGDVVTFYVTIDARMDGGQLRGPVLASTAGGSAELVVNSEGLTLARGDARFRLGLVDVGVEAAANPSLRASRGMARVSALDAFSEPIETEIEVPFTNDAP